MTGVVDDAPDDLDERRIEGALQNRSLTVAEKISLLRWHIDRYDRLRVSTASRASVVLSAGAILFAGNAVVLSQLLGSSATPLRPWVMVIFTLGALVSASLVVLALIRASGVLVTSRDSAAMFSGTESLPPSPIFNGTFTVRRLSTFADFHEVVKSQREQEILQAAEVELWIGIRQHRHRYVRLRRAVRLLRCAAVAFLVVLAGSMIVNLLRV